MNRIEDFEESLDDIVEEIRYIDNMCFDTWYQALARVVSSYMSIRLYPKRFSYEDCDDYDFGEPYLGIERRSKVRSVFNTVQYVKTTIAHHMMPKTLEIKGLK